LVLAMPHHVQSRRVLMSGRASDGMSIRAPELRDVRRRLERYYGVEGGVLVDLQFINDNIVLLAARRRFLLRYLALLAAGVNQYDAYVQTRTEAVGQGAWKT